ncbi:MAG TPA: DUF4259 domain-containing protein [Burkholderiaceae bacterium]
MGTWSHEPFGNDAANDWAHDLDGRKDFSLIDQAMQRVIDSGPEYLESDFAVEAVVAAEVLAMALSRGTQSDAYTEKVEAWLQSIAVKPEAALFIKAQRALARILDKDSELRDLWEESDEFESWEASIKALQQAIGD